MLGMLTLCRAKALLINHSPHVNMFKRPPKTSSLLIDAVCVCLVHAVPTARCN